MFSFGWLELILIFIIIIIVVGPREIPNLLNQLGLFSRSLKSISNQFKESLSSLAEEAEIKNSISDISDIKNSLDPSKILNEEIDSIKKTVKFTDKEITNINNKIMKK